MLGFLELEDSVDTLLGYLGRKWPTAVRIEAVTSAAVRARRRSVEEGGAQADGAAQRAATRWCSRAARETLTVLKFGPEFADELAELVGSPDNEVGPAVGDRAARRAGARQQARGEDAAAGRASSNNRAKAEAAAKVLARHRTARPLLVDALADASDEVGAQVLAEALNPLAAKLTKKDVKKLLEAGDNAARQVVRDRQAAARAGAERRPRGLGGGCCARRRRRSAKKDPARAEAISELLGRDRPSPSRKDRFGAVLQQLQHHSLDLHPRARQRDTVLMVLERLHAEGFKVAEAVNKDKKLTDEARYYLGVHFAEKPQFELKGIGAEVLESLAEQGQGQAGEGGEEQDEAARALMSPRERGGRQTFPADGVQTVVRRLGEK